MNLEQCYEMFGGNYQEVKRRLMKDERIERFLRLFPADGSFELLEKAVAEEDWANAFRAAHTLKGLTMNLSIDRLSQSAVTVTELLRNGPPAEDITPMLSQLREDYQLTVRAIDQLHQDA